MRLTTKGRFAVTAMMDVGLHQRHGPVSLSSVSERQHISLSYLEQLFGRLRQHKLVQSTRGPGGGYSLGKAAAQITVADIIVAVDEPLDATQCGGKQNCLGEKQGQCMTHDLWTDLNHCVINFLDSISLQKLLENHKAKPNPIHPHPLQSPFPPKLNNSHQPSHSQQ